MIVSAFGSTLQTFWSQPIEVIMKLHIKMYFSLLQLTAFNIHYNYFHLIAINMKLSVWKQFTNKVLF